MTNKLSLLSASRAYLLQSPTCTRVTLNLVYHFGKSLNTYSNLVHACPVEEEV